MIKINGSAVLLGIFDGLHRGHMSAVNELLKFPGKKIVYTFNSLTVSTKGDRKLLLTDREKVKMLYDLGADQVVSEDFQAVRSLSAHGFLDIIVRRELDCDTVIAGENFRFGSGAIAGKNELKIMCEHLGMKAIIVPTVCAAGEPVSTTRIRNLIERGDVSEANRLLGRRYGINGRLSRTLRTEGVFSLRTLSMSIDKDRVVPKMGIYATHVIMSGKSYGAVTNIRELDDKNDGRVYARSIILSQPAGLFGENGSVLFDEFIRPPRDFATVDQLKEAFKKDIEAAERIAEFSNKSTF